MLLQVGACLVAPSRQIHVISVGFNAYPDDMIITNEHDMEENSQNSSF